jgi:C-terminal processing protease CtpA/Prc
MRKLFYFILIISLGVASACKKDKPSNTNSTAFQLTQDSIYMIAQEDYYWNTSLPEYSIFNPRQYTNGSTDLIKFTGEINAYTQKSKNSANDNLPYEYDPFNPGSSKYSFIDDGTENGELNAIKGDFGFNYFYNRYTDLRVSLVYPNSPAAAAGLKRGDQITAVNDNSNIYIVTNLNDPVNDPAYKYVSNALNNGGSVTLKIVNANGTRNVVLNAKNYTVNPVIYTNTYTLNGGKVAGYMVFNSFVSLDGNPDVKARLDSVFNAFASKNVTDLIIDLRYNSGGDVNTSTYLSNLIVPSGTAGEMNTTYWTANMQNDNYPILRKKLYQQNGHYKPENQKEMFAKTGPLSVTRVFFLVTGNTASASELTINNVRPKMNVQLVGDTTYGKPVGFISNLIINGHYLYTPEFEIKNSSGQGGYYTGMPPAGSTPTAGTFQGKQIYEDIVADFGDKSETLLNQALIYIQTGAWAQTPKQSTLSLSNGLTMSAYQRKVLAAKTQPLLKNSMYITLKPAKK